MIRNNIVLSEWGETFRLSQPSPSLFYDGNLFLAVEVTNSLLTISSLMSHEVSLCVNGQESEFPFSVKTYESEYSEIADESGNIYESGKISCSVKPSLKYISENGSSSSFIYLP